MACYAVFSGATKLLDHIYPCGPVNATTPHVPCCDAGTTCIPGGLCEYTHSQPLGSGFYAAGCTDPSWKAPSCRRLCRKFIVSQILTLSSLAPSHETNRSPRLVYQCWYIDDLWADKRYRPDVVYSASNKTWACCGTSDAIGSPDCTWQSNETFNLAPPQELRAYFSIPPTGFPYTSVAIQTVSSSAASTTSSSTSAVGGGDSSSSSLSLGAAAGVGVGAGFAVLLFGVAGLATWHLWRKRRRATTEQLEALQPSYQKNSQSPRSTNSEEDLVKPELNDRCLPREMTEEMIREMPA